MPFLFCLPFANRASDSGDLYIDFNRNHLMYPVAYFVCQDYAWFIFSFWSTHMHCISHLAYHVMFCIMLLAHCIVIDVCPFLIVFLPWVEPGDEYVNEEPVKNAYEDQAFVNSENLAGKMTKPSKSLLSLLARCSLFCYSYAAIPTTCYNMPPILPCQPLTIHVLANR